MEVIVDTQMQMNFSKALDRDYIAGFFDGEGCVAVCKVTTPGEKIKGGRDGAMYEKFFLVVQITQRTREVLDCVQSMYGGMVRQHSGKRPCYYWVVRGKYALPFLNDMESRVHIKGPQIALAKEFIALPRSWNVERRREIYHAMSALNGLRNFWRKHVVTPESLVRVRKRKVVITEDGVGLEE